MTPNLQRLLDAATRPISVKEWLIPDSIGEHDDMAELLDVKGKSVGIQMWNPKEKDLAVLRLIAIAVNHIEELMAALKTGIASTDDALILAIEFNCRATEKVMRRRGDELSAFLAKIEAAAKETP